ncbi:MAG: hypothetical protein MI757_12595 [Pirellulales bacterium]|nr:hypothetical protein [Pirellulales bacterium]
MAVEGLGHWREDPQELLRLGVKQLNKQPSNEAWKQLSIVQQSPQDDDTLLSLMLEFVRSALWDAKKNEPRHCLPPDVVNGIAADLNLALFNFWKDELCGPLTERYLNIHSKEQLEQLGRDCGAWTEIKGPKSYLIEQFLASRETGPLKFPAELEKCKQPKGFWEK